jgi:hypothetical protein
MGGRSPCQISSLSGIGRLRREVLSVRQLELVRQPTRQDEIREHFARFHLAHPQVWMRFAHHVRRLKDRGATHYSARTLISVIRFERDLEFRDWETGLRVNDHFSPYYGRLWEIAHPEDRGFFSKRKLISASRPPRGGEGSGGFGPDEPSSDLDAFLMDLLGRSPT